ncbi:MAG: pyridoxamine 5'-phosphate oxidase family protein [Cyanobacteria bacterium J06635_11]
MNNLYYEGNRDLQDQFDSRRLADRVNEVIVHDRFTDEDRQLIETRDMFFISTVDAEGRPTVSYKGGAVGFIRIVDDQTLAYPGYDGNGMFLTSGNIAANNNVGLLFIDFENPRRLRMHGTATVDTQDPLLAEYVDANYIIRVTVRNLFINCPRYIHRYQKLEDSEYLPKAGRTAPTPAWKTLEIVQDVLPQR